MKTFRRHILYRGGRAAAICRIIAVLICLAAPSFGQTASFRYEKDNKDTVEIDFGAAAINSTTVEAIYLLNTRTGEMRTYKFSPSPAAGELPIVKAGGTGLLSEIYRINVPNIPETLAEAPVVLNVIVRPDPALPERTVQAITVRQVGVIAKPEDIKLGITEAEGEDDAEFYLAGEIIAARDSKPKMSADLKYERGLGFKDVPGLITPFFKLKISNTQEDSDKLNFGVKFSNSFGFSLFKSNNQLSETPKEIVRQKTLANIQRLDTTKETPQYTKLKRSAERRMFFELSTSAEIESDSNFRVTNFISSPELQWKILPKIFREKRQAKASIFLTPFIGADVGRNIKSPVVRDEKNIARLKGGATLTLNLRKPFGELVFQSLKWESKFTRRWYAAKEQAYDEDDDGNLVLQDFGKRPRNHFVSDLNFKLNKLFGVGLKYEWGEEPPLYKKVYHRLTVGFTYSFKRDIE